MIMLEIIPILQAGILIHHQQSIQKEMIPLLILMMKEHLAIHSAINIVQDLILDHEQGVKD